MADDMGSPVSKWFFGRSPTDLMPFALLAVVVAGIYAAFFSFTADDALIVARYARNLIAGNGLVFNVGENVSALTSPFHALILALLSLAPATAYIGYKILSVGLVIATLSWMSMRLFSSDGERLCFLALVAASPFVVLWTVGGLETPLLLSALGIFHALAWRRDQGATGESGVAAIYMLAALAFLIRHDSALLTAPVVAHRIFLNRHSLRHWIAISAAALLPAAWLAFAWIYYGDILPTSFYLKMPSLGPDVLRGGVYLLSFLVVSGALLAMLPIWRHSDISSAGRAGVLRRNLPVLAGLLLFGVYVLTAGTKHMMFSYRLLVPVVPVVALIAIMAGRLAGDWLETIAFAGLALLAQVLLSVWVYSVTLNPTVMHVFGPRFSGMFEYSQQSLDAYVTGFVPAMEANAMETRADWQARRLEHRAPRVHTFGAGVLPYVYGDAYILDSLAGYRHECDFDWEDWRRAADYMHVMWPLHGSLEEQLGPLLARAELVSRQEIMFDGTPQHLDVYYNPRPLPKRQSDRVDRPC